MAKYVCPECQSEGQFTEVFIMSMEVTGKFNDVGEIDGTADCLSTETDRYICLACNEEFDKPLEINEKET